MVHLVLFLITLCGLGFALFCVAAGFVMFKVICVRSSYTKKSPVDGGTHVKDLRIMPSLLAAKERWAERPLEKLTIVAEFSGLFKRFCKKRQSKILLGGDLWVHADVLKNKKIAIIVHGFSDSSAGMAYLAEAYYERGISVLAVNLRGHGDSTGRFAGLGYVKTDGADLARWVDYAMQRFGVDTQIILHGVSMGGASVIQCAFGLHVPVVLVVADCAFADFSAQMQRHLQGLFGGGFLQTLLSKGILSSASLINFFVNGFFFSQNSPKKILEKVARNAVVSENGGGEGVPLLLFHGLADTMTRPSNAEELFCVASEPKKLELINDAPHIGSWFYETEKYMKMVCGYLSD